MNKYNVINYHITNRCNYSCKYCFGKFDGQDDPSFEDAKMAVDNIADYFSKNGISQGRINIAGGEPTLYKHLDPLISYISSLSIAVSIVTNGSLLTPERIRGWRGAVSCIGLSIDSTERKTNINIGRCCGERTMTLSDWFKLSLEIKECGIALKVNTVASRLNISEDLSPLYRILSPQKIKLLEMHLVEGINDKAEVYKIEREEFLNFVRRYKEFESLTVSEPYGSMENSYLMINPHLDLQINDGGRYRTFGNLKTESLCDIMAKAPIDVWKFNSRYKREEKR